MPIYEFHCKACSSDFSSLRRSGQTDEVHCPNCGGAKVARLLSVTAKSAADSQYEACGQMAGSACMRPGGCGCRN
jgi:putative FmdB family regulatory protein